MRETETYRKRSISFDIMKGLGILLMIIGHYELLPAFIHSWIFSFHMPLFFLISGYCFKPTPDHKTFWKKNVKRLLIPYIITALIVVLLSAVSAIKNSDPNLFKHQSLALIFPTGIYPEWMQDLFGWTGGIGAIWFLIALFWCRIFVNLLICAKVPIWSIILIGTAATFLDHFVINPPFALFHGISAMVFFIIGHWSSKQPFRWIPVAICLICWIFCFLFSKLETFTCTYRYYPLDVIGACGGTLFTFFISRYLSGLTSLGYGLARFLAWIGRASLAILCAHTIFFIFHPFKALHISNAWFISIPLNIVAPLLVAYVFSKINFTRNLFGMMPKMRY